MFSSYIGWSEIKEFTKQDLLVYAKDSGLPKMTIGHIGIVVSSQSIGPVLLLLPF